MHESAESLILSQIVYALYDLFWNYYAYDVSVICSLIRECEPTVSFPTGGDSERRPMIAGPDNITYAWIGGFERERRGRS